MKNWTLISRVLGLGLGTRVLGLGIRVLGLGLGREAQVLVNITADNIHYKIKSSLLRKPGLAVGRFGHIENLWAVLVHGPFWSFFSGGR